MKNKLITTALLLATSATLPSASFANGLMGKAPAIAATAPQINNAFFANGLYGGLGAGVNRLFTSNHGRLNAGSFVIGAVDQDFKFKDVVTGISGEVFLGSRFNLGNGCILGLELEAISDTARTKNIQGFQGLLDNVILTFKTRRRFGFIPSISLGKVFAERWLPYVKLGVPISRFETKILDPQSSDAAGVSTFFGGAPVPRSFKTNDTRVGIMPAIGLAFAATDKVSLRSEASYEFYRSISTTRVIQNANDFIVQNRYKPRIAKLMFSVAWDFK